MNLNDLLNILQILRKYSPHLKLDIIHEARTGKQYMFFHDDFLNIETLKSYFTEEDRNELIKLGLDFENLRYILYD